VDLHHGAVDVGLGRRRADHHALGDLVVGQAVRREGDGLALGAAAYEEAKRLMVEECETAGSITLARFRDLLGTGRKPAQLLLERFDADGLTRRVGDERVLRRRAKTA